MGEQMRPTKEQMEAMETAVDACLDGGRGFQFGPCHPEGGFVSLDDAIGYVADGMRRTHEATPETARELWAVHVPKGVDESLFVCLTGNGPTSEAHARFIAIAPWAIKALLAEVGALTATVAERDAERVVRELDDWSDAEGCVLWWRLPVDEPPYVGTPGDSDWPGYHTHWTRLPPAPWDEHLPPEERRP